MSGDGKRNRPGIKKTKIRTQEGTIGLNGAHIKNRSTDIGPKHIAQTAKVARKQERLRWQGEQAVYVNFSTVILPFHHQKCLLMNIRD